MKPRRSRTWDSFIRGFPSMDTSLYTQPSAGCAWHVTRLVPIPKVSMECPCGRPNTRHHYELGAPQPRQAVCTIGPGAMTMATINYSVAGRIRKTTLQFRFRPPKKSSCSSALDVQKTTTTSRRSPTAKEVRTQHSTITTRKPRREKEPIGNTPGP